MRRGLWVETPIKNIMDRKQSPHSTPTRKWNLTDERTSVYVSSMFKLRFYGNCIFNKFLENLGCILLPVHKKTNHVVSSPALLEIIFKSQLSSRIFSWQKYMWGVHSQVECVVGMIYSSPKFCVQTDLRGDGSGHRWTICRQWNFFGGFSAQNSSVVRIIAAVDTIVPLIWVLHGSMVGLYTRTQNSCFLFLLNEKQVICPCKIQWEHLSVSVCSYDFRGCSFQWSILIH
jgi:hypothetical protein